ncbi:MAG: thiolase family protein [Thermodesulfobacteriota bacterium]
MKSNDELRAMRKVYVGGLGRVRFQRYEDQEYYDFASQALLNCLDEAEMQWKDVQAAFCGNVYAGTGKGHQVIAEVGLTGIPIINMEQACSSSSAAFRMAYLMVATEIYDVVAVLGFEKMGRGLLASTAFKPWELALGFNVQPANYAQGVVRYMETYGATEEDLARVVVLERKNADHNPYARWYQSGEVTVEEVIQSRVVAAPVRLMHAAAMVDGAVSLILCSGDKLKSAISRSKKIEVAASVHTTGIYGEGSVKYPAATNLVKEGVKQAWEISGYGPEDMDLIQVYEAMAPAFLTDIEDMGFCKPGESPRLLKEGYFDINGKLPTNTDGGLVGCGHPLGATGARQIAEIVTQLRGAAGPRQVEKARIGLTHSSGAGPNAVFTILKRA